MQWQIKSYRGTKRNIARRGAAKMGGKKDKEKGDPILIFHNEERGFFSHLQPLRRKKKKNLNRAKGEGGKNSILVKQTTPGRRHENNQRRKRKGRVGRKKKCQVDKIAPN